MTELTRRGFLAGAAGLAAVAPLRGRERAPSPIVISTWRHGLAANDAAWEVLGGGGSSLDAVEAGVRVSEGDPEVTSVGRGGLPNEEGVVQLDAAIMDGRSLRAGSVAALERIAHPVSVARKVMESTRHVLLVGEGALRFARAQGFEEEELLSERARKRWLAWKKNHSEKDFWQENHDTIGMVALDRQGHLSCACTTSGLAWKLPGRVGDSPLIGHGSYVDGEVGGAAATGIGEAVIRTCGSFLVVERMRAGVEPSRACEEALERIRDRVTDLQGQVAYIALRRDGEWGAAALRPGFGCAVARGGKNRLVEIDPMTGGRKERAG